MCVCFATQDVKKKISKCKEEKSLILDLSKSEVGSEPTVMLLFLAMECLQLATNNLNACILCLGGW